jgi:hypothetical protein
MITAIERQTLAAYEAIERNIPDSDLDDAQPLTLLVKTTLGEVRRIYRANTERERGARGVERDLLAREDYDANL